MDQHDTTRTLNWKRVIAIAVTGALVIGASYVVAARRQAGTAAPAAPVAAAGTEAVPFGPSPAEIDRQIALFERRAAAGGGIATLTHLGTLYLQRATLTGDVGAYDRAASALERAHAIDPGDPDLKVRLAAAVYALHDFERTLDLAAAVLDEDPARFDAAALAADAALALGDVASADAAYAGLGAALPDDPAVLVRRSRLAWLTGSADEAIAHADAAVAAATGRNDYDHRIAFYQAYRAGLAFDLGDYTAARDGYESALTIRPGWHVASAGLGRSLAALGEFDGAIAHYQSAVTALPDPVYLAALGDLYALAGRDAEAAVQFETVAAISTLDTAGLYGREISLYLSDHALRPDEAVALARADLGRRSDVHAHDTLAWALYRAGDLPAAREAADAALALGTLDARIWYHAGMISAALGDTDRAVVELSRALQISPRFDPIHADVAAATLAGLQGGTS